MQLLCEIKCLELILIFSCDHKVELSGSHLISKNFTSRRILFRLKRNNRDSGNVKYFATVAGGHGFLCPISLRTNASKEAVQLLLKILCKTNAIQRLVGWTQ